MNAWRTLCGFAVLGAMLAPRPAQAITRSEVIARAKAYVYHPWRATTANATGSCAAPYKSLFAPADYLGLPYNWGGYQTLAEFDKRIVSGDGAGAQQTDGVLSCTAGVDCSGFVSMVWRTGHYTTSNLDQTSSAIAQGALIAGDVMNKAGYHVAMFGELLGNGEPAFYEAAGYNVHYNPYGGWSYVNGYTPRRYNAIEGTSASSVEGSPADPIVIGAFPYADSRDTRQSRSSVLDRCALAPNTGEAGPEYVYKLSLTQPGTLTVTVTDDANADIDVHIYSSMNANDCLARNDSTISKVLDCGTYYIVADSFSGTGGVAQAGAYNLMATFSPSGGACGAGPPGYATTGKLGDPCAYPGNRDLGFCNPTLGADTCVYTSGADAISFCSRPCASSADCAGLPGACCQDLGNQELYCVTSALCGGSGTVDPNPTTGPDDLGDATDLGDSSVIDAAGAGETDAGTTGAVGGGCALGGVRALPSLSSLLLLCALFVLRRRMS